MAQQLTLDFRPRAITGKKTQRITITCSPDFKSIIEKIANIQDTDASKLGHRYFVEGIQRDLGTIFMAEPHLDSKLKDILTGIG